MSDAPDLARTTALASAIYELCVAHLNAHAGAGQPTSHERVLECLSALGHVAAAVIDGSKGPRPLLTKFLSQEIGGGFRTIAMIDAETRH
jgi:hypothetical protein